MMLNESYAIPYDKPGHLIILRCGTWEIAVFLVLSDTQVLFENHICSITIGGGRENFIYYVEKIMENSWPIPFFAPAEFGSSGGHYRYIFHLTNKGKFFTELSWEICKYR